MTIKRANKVTISLSQELLEFVDRLARQDSKSRSAVFADLVRDKRDAEIKAQMAEGYREMSDENLREAEEWLEITSEVILRGG